MATPPCTLCGQYQGAFIFTNLEDGDSPVICMGCAPSFAVGLAAAFTEGITKAQADDMAGALDAIYVNDPRPAKRAPKGKRAGTTLAAVPELPPGGPQRVRSARTAAGAADDTYPYSASDNAPPSAIVLEPPCPLCGGSEGTGTNTKLTCDSCGAVIATNPPAPPTGDDDHA